MKESDYGIAEYDEIKAKRYAEHLTSKYPGHLWAVVVQDEVAKIFNLYLSGNWGFAIRTKDIDGGMKALTRAGGELLERYNISRSKFNATDYEDVLRDARGVPFGDKS